MSMEKTVHLKTITSTKHMVSKKVEPINSNPFRYTSINSASVYK